MPFLISVLIAIQAGIAPPPVQASDLTKDDLRAVAVMIAIKYELDPARFVKVVQCESSFNRDAVGALGEIGLVQIYPKYHPTVTKEQMLNPVWSMDWMAKQWKAGRQGWWSCYGLTGK